MTQLETTDGFQNRAIANHGVVLSSSEEIVARYRRHVDHFDMSEMQKAELLLAVWHMMHSFVDRAFGDDAVQLCLKNGDENQLSRDGELLPVISSEDHNHPGERTLTDAFKKRAGRERRKEKR